MTRRRGDRLAKPSGPAELAERWRADAAVLRHRGAETLATCLETCAGELAAWGEAWRLEELTLEQAAQESGFSYSHLQHLVAGMHLKNRGSARRPRIRRGDLPHKVGHAESSTLGIADQVLAARHRRAS